MTHRYNSYTIKLSEEQKTQLEEILTTLPEEKKRS